MSAIGTPPTPSDF